MKVSIITPTYNSGATLRDTMLSVLAQSHADIEHIIIDGASTDDTLNVIRELEPLYRGRLKWVSGKDQGLYDAMNKGLAMATGDIVGVLNSDDFFTAPEVVAKFLREFDVETDAVYGDVHFVHPSDLNRCVRYYSSANFAKWRMLFGYQPAHPSFYCRRDIYRRLGNFDPQFKVAADFDHFLRLIYLNGIRTHYIPMDFVTMRTGGASTANIRSHFTILKDHLRAYRKNKVYGGFFLDYFRYFMKAGEIMVQKLSRHRKAKRRVSPFFVTMTLSPEANAI